MCKANDLQKEIIKLFEDSNADFLENEVVLILSGVSERCLCGSLMTHIRYKLDKSSFSEYHADIEYNRNFGGTIKRIMDGNEIIIPITCDLIVHSRGENLKQDNLLAIEMKRIEHDEGEKTKDRNRLIALSKPTFDEEIYSADGETLPEYVCGYVLGVFYEFDLESRHALIEYYSGGELCKTNNIDF